MVFVANGDQFTSQVSQATIGGKSLTLLRTDTSAGTATDRATVLYIRDPPSGAQSLIVNYTAGSFDQVGVISLFGVLPDSSVIEGSSLTKNTVSTGGTVSITTMHKGDAVLFYAYAETNQAQSSSGFTQDWAQITNNAVNAIGGHLLQSSASTATGTYTTSGATEFMFYAVALQPLPALFSQTQIGLATQSLFLIVPFILILGVLTVIYLEVLHVDVIEPKDVLIFLIAATIVIIVLVASVNLIQSQAGSF